MQEPTAMSSPPVLLRSLAVGALICAPDWICRRLRWIDRLLLGDRLAGLYDRLAPPHGRQVAQARVELPQAQVQGPGEAELAAGGRVVLLVVGIGGFRGRPCTGNRRVALNALGSLLAVVSCERRMQVTWPIDAVRGAKGRKNVPLSGASRQESAASKGLQAEQCQDRRAIYILSGITVNQCKHVLAECIGFDHDIHVPSICFSAILLQLQASICGSLLPKDPRYVIDKDTDYQ